MRMQSRIDASRSEMRALLTYVSPRADHSISRAFTHRGDTRALCPRASGCSAGTTMFHRLARARLSDSANTP